MYDDAAVVVVVQIRIPNRARCTYGLAALVHWPPRLYDTDRCVAPVVAAAFFVVAVDACILITVRR